MGSNPITITNFKITNSKYDGPGASSNEQGCLTIKVSDYKNITLSGISENAYVGTEVQIINNDTGARLLTGEGSANLASVNNIRIQVDFSSYSRNPAWVNIANIHIT